MMRFGATAFGFGHSSYDIRAVQPCVAYTGGEIRKRDRNCFRQSPRHRSASGEPER